MEEKTLKIAKALCEQYQFMSVQELGKIYLYRNGFYEVLSSTKVNAGIHSIIMGHDQSLTPSKRDSVIRNIEALKAVPEPELNPEGIFCFYDCLFDIRSNTIASHDSQYKITIQLPYTFKTCIEAPLWRKFIHDVTEGDELKSNILQEFAGYCLSKSCHLEKSLFLIGSGSNGKSVFSETLSKVFGRQNISAVSLEALSNPVLRSNILGKFINIDSDLPRNAEKFEEIFRKITSGEPILFNEKFLPPITVSPSCKLIYCLNEFPTIDDTSNAFYRRMLLIPFNVEFINGNQDQGLKQKLESELPGIFRWCVEGYKRVMKQGFTKAIFMEDDIKEIRIDNNPIIAFAESELDFDPIYPGITKSGMYKYYKQWILDHGHRPLSFRKFNNRFYNIFKRKTRKDKQRPDEDRAAYWPNIKYKKSSISEGTIIGWTE